MKATNTPYDTLDLSESIERIREILDAGDSSFEKRDSIPPGEVLTFTNGFDVNCAALFIDIRGSSNLPRLHPRSRFSKIYRAYISECVAIINSHSGCKELFIAGDCVSGILDTPKRADVWEAFETAGKLASLVKILNWEFKKRNIVPIECGIGLDYGAALMIKAGYKGVGINDITWMGDVVNSASNLCGMGSKDGRLRIQVSTAIHLNLHDEYRQMLYPVKDASGRLTHYQADVVNVPMDKWLDGEQASARIRESLATFLRPAPQPQIPINSFLGLLNTPTPQIPVPPPQRSLGSLLNLPAPRNTLLDPDPISPGLGLASLLNSKWPKS